MRGRARDPVHGQPCGRRPSASPRRSIFATLGELICERAGVLNLGIEGIMTAGAFAGWLTVYQGGDLWLGVLVAALAGAAFGLLHAFWSCRSACRSM